MDNITTEYIQFSKRVTYWGIILVSFLFILSLVAITFFITMPEAISTISTLYAAYITIMGVTIGAYQGNSSLEKWVKAKYQYENLNKNKENEEE
jgi:predicted tellurium resistance membrane protein TerC